MRVAEKAGMVRERVQPQSAIKAGRVIDRVVYASLPRGAVTLGPSPQPQNFCGRRTSTSLRNMIIE